MTVRMTSITYGHQVDESSIEVDDDFRATGWQDSGSVVGRFARDLTATERTRLQRALASAVEAAAGLDRPDPGRRRSPSGYLEQVTADGLDVVIEGNDEPPAGVEPLVELLTGLRENLLESPVAAVELVVSGSPLGARIRHAGGEPIALRGGSLTVESTAFDRDSSVVGGTTQTVEVPGLDGPVEAGWELPLTDDLGLPKRPKGGFLTVSVGPLEVDSRGDGILRETALSWMDE